MPVVPAPPPQRQEEEEEERPALTLVGTDPMAEALAAALERHGASVECCTVEGVAERVFVSAPDAVVLIGDAAEDDGQTVLKQLSSRLATAVIPAILISSDKTLDSKLSAFRYGAVAVVTRSASVDEMARHVTEKARELPERSETSVIGEASVDELVELFSRRLRTGLLAVTAPGAGPEASAHVVLRGDGNVTQTIEELVRRVRPLVAHSEPLQIEFQESPTGKLRALGLVDEPSLESDLVETLAGRRLLLVERSPARADELVQVLRDLKARVVIVDGEGEGLDRARAVDPDVVVVDASGVGGWATRTLHALRHDVRLRWASLLVVKGEELWPAGQSVADIPRLSAGIQPLVAPDDALTARARQPGAFEVRLESTGPVRLLRAVARSERTLHLLVRGAKVRVEIDVAEGLVVGATARGQGTQAAAGPGAIATLLAMSTARVRIEPRQAPKVANLMCPVDDAVAASVTESPLVRPSLPPPSLPPPARMPSVAPGRSDDASAPTPSRPIDARELLGQLESMLVRLKTAMPDVVHTDAEPRAALPAPAAMPPPNAPPPGAPTRARPPKRTLLGVAAPTAPVAPRAPVPVASAVTTAPYASSPPPAPEPSPAMGASSAPYAMPPSPPLPPPPAFPTVGANAVLGAYAPSPEFESGQASASAAPPNHAPPNHEPAGTLAASMFDLPMTTMPPPALDGHSYSTGSTVAPMLASERSVVTAAAPVVVVPEEDALPVERAGRVMLVVGALLVVALGVGGAAWGWTLYAGAPEVAAVLPLLPPEPILVPPLTPPVALEPVALEPVALAPIPLLLGPADLLTVLVDAGLPSALENPAGVVAAEPLAAVESPGSEPAGVASAAPPALGPATDVTADVATDVPADATGGDAATTPEDESSGSDPRARAVLLARLIREANYARSHGDGDAAEAGYLHVLRLDRGNARALAGLVRLYQARNEPRTALFWARRLTTLHGEMPANHVLLGDILEATGDHAAARAAWERALAISPDHRAARRRLGGDTTPD